MRLRTRGAQWLVVAGSFAAAASCARTSSVTNPAQPPAWRLAWSDEFDGPAGAPPDTRWWTPEIGDGCSRGICGWGNEEKESYTADAANLALDGQGRLAITARLSAGGLQCHYGPCRYTSARIKTEQKVLAAPGRVEARIRLPAGQGLWPAFWLLGENIAVVPWPRCGELDVMENHGSNPASTSSAIHGPGYSGQTPFARSIALASGTFADDFHVFAVEWDSTAVRFSVDSVPSYVVTRSVVEHAGPWVFDQPFFVILNLAVGGHFDGDPRSDAVLPATMLVDWVRVYDRHVSAR